MSLYFPQVDRNRRDRIRSQGHMNDILSGSQQTRMPLGVSETHQGFPEGAHAPGHVGFPPTRFKGLGFIGYALCKNMNYRHAAAAGLTPQYLAPAGPWSIQETI